MVKGRNHGAGGVGLERAPRRANGDLFVASGSKLQSRWLCLAICDDLLNSSSSCDGETMQGFLHEPLTSGKDEIRLVKVLPPCNDIIACTIETFETRHCPAYECLSYVWGESCNGQQIILNGRSFTVGSNLHTFLVHVGNGSITLETDTHYASDWLWIDQLCIDQTSTVEKSKQVRRMAQTYGDAARTIVWLGDATSRTAGAMSMIRDLRTHFSNGITTMVDRGSVSATATSAKKADLRDIDVYHWLCNPYFTRVWTVQEFWLSRDLLLVMGTEAIEWSTLSKVWPMLKSRAEEFHTPSDDLIKRGVPAAVYIDHKHSTEAWKYLSLDDQHAHTPSWSLHTALGTFGGLQTSDKRDIVYGLLGIVNERERLIIDYDKTPQLVFWDAMDLIHSNVEISTDHWMLFFDLGLRMNVPGVELARYRIKHRPADND